VSLFETCRRLPTSATALRRASTDPSSRILAGTEAATSFLFSRATLPSLRKRWSARRAARRPIFRIPVPVPPASRRFARPRYPIDRATFVGLHRRSVVTIDVHGSLDRAKDASPIDDEPRWPRDGCMHLMVHADDVPLLSAQRTPAVAGAIAGREETLPTDRTDQDLRSGAAPRRVTSSRKAWVPSTVATRERERIAPPASASASRSRRPHVFPGLGRHALDGHCKRQREETPRRHSRVRAPFSPAGRAWD
jgi:hypothetical protein